MYSTSTHFLLYISLFVLAPVGLMSADQAEFATHVKVRQQSIQMCPEPSLAPVSDQPADQVAEFFGGLFSTIHWPARWYCGNWSDFHGWFSIASDFFVWASYFAIPIILFTFLYRKRVPKEFRSIFWLFIAFIMCCGLTHLMEVIIFWWPAYRLSTLISFLTATVSSITVFALVKAIPSTLKYKSPAELQQLIDERTQQLEAKTAQLEEMNKELKQFAYVAAHDLKAPLANIESLVQILRKGKYDHTNEIQLFERINNTIVQSKDKIEALNDVLEIKNIKGKPTVETNVLKVLNDSVSSIDELVKENSATMEIDIDRQVMVPMSEVYLSTIFQNLITNALKYRKIDVNPRVRIKSKKVLRNVIIEVSDNGRGIDLEKYGHKFFGLFQRFHLDVNGKGVGLYITKSLMENFGGSIEIESAVDVGTTFRLIFPISTQKFTYENAQADFTD